MRTWVIPMLLAGALAACEGNVGQAKKEGLGKATADAANDTQLLGRVESAANDVLRNPADCESVKAAMPEAVRAMDEAENKLQTAAGRATLKALRTQVQNVGQNCP